MLEHNFDKMDNLSQEEFDTLVDNLFKLCVDSKVYLVQLRRFIAQLVWAQEMEAAEEMRLAHQQIQRDLERFVDELCDLVDPAEADDVRQFFLE